MTEEEFQAPDLELQQRLDAAFSQTGPRRGFEDLLWARLDGRARRRLARRAAWIPRGAWPALGVVATALVAVIVALPLLFHGSSNGGSSSQVATSLSASPREAGPRAAQPGAATLAPAGGFGPLPTPTLTGPDQQAPIAGVVPYYGPALLSVTVSVGSLPLTLPVFRFTQPTRRQAVAAARGYGADLVTSSSGPFREPRFQLKVTKADSGSGSALPDAAALSATDAFLVSKKMSWAWSPLRQVVDEGPVALVHYVRQFDVVGYGKVAQVDQLGAPAGADVAVRSDGKVFQAVVPMQVALRSSGYPARPAQRAALDAVNLPPPSPVGFSPLPQVQLSQADLVYVALSAGAYGYFEPAILFRGAFSLGSTRYEKRVLVPALDASRLK